MATTLLLKMLMLVSSTMASKYILVQEKMSWPHADNYCKETYGTSLATAWDFDADMNALSKLFQSVGSDTSGWIGLYITDDVTGEWQWTSGFHWLSVYVPFCGSKCMYILVEIIHVIQW